MDQVNVMNQRHCLILMDFQKILVNYKIEWNFLDWIMGIWLDIIIDFFRYRTMII